MCHTSQKHSGSETAVRAPIHTRSSAPVLTDSPLATATMPPARSTPALSTRCSTNTPRPSLPSARGASGPSIPTLRKPQVSQPPATSAQHLTPDPRASLKQILTEAIRVQGNYGGSQANQIARIQQWQVSVVNALCKALNIETPKSHDIVSRQAPGLALVMRVLEQTFKGEAMPRVPKFMEKF